MYGFIEQLVHERKRLTKLKEIYPEIMIEYAVIENILKTSGLKTVEEVLSNDSTLALELKKACREVYEQIIARKSGSSSSEVLIENWVERGCSTEHGYRTSYGHRIQNKRVFDKLGSYWVIRPDHYEYVKPTQWEEFAFIVCDETYYLSKEVESIRWGN